MCLGHRETYGFTHSLRRARAEGARDEGRRMRQVARVRSPALERGHAPLGDPPWGQVPPRPSMDRLAKPRELALHPIGLDVGPPRALDPVPHLRHPPVAARAKQLLRFERRSNRPQAHGRGERPPAHRGEDGVARDREALCEQPHPASQSASARCRSRA